MNTHSPPRSGCGERLARETKTQVQEGWSIPTTMLEAKVPPHIRPVTVSELDGSEI